MFRRLDHFADIHYGKSPSPVMDMDGAIPVYGTGGVYAHASKPLFLGPAVIVPRKGSLGSPHIAAGPFWASDTTYAVIPKSGVDPHWLYYQLCHFELEKLNEATGVPSISRDWLSKIDIADQDEPTQTAAAARIRCLEGQITHTEAQIDQSRWPQCSPSSARSSPSWKAWAGRSSTRARACAGRSGAQPPAQLRSGLSARCVPGGGEVDQHHRGRAGMRKAAGRRLADAGCTAHEIMAVLGHTTLAEAERYTREADQVRLAPSAVIKLEGHNRNGVPQTTPAKFGKTS